MKLYKLVSYTSLGVVLFLAVVLGSLPFRFPGDIILWNGIAQFLVPAIAIVVLLFIMPLCPKKVFRMTILFATGVAVLGMILGWISPLLLGIFFAACIVLYLHNSKTFRTTSEADEAK